MKKLILIILFIFPALVFSQVDIQKKDIDTMSIIYKAKTFTISKHGFKDIESQISSLKNMPYEIYGTNEFLFIKIKGNFFCEEKGNVVTFAWCECDYYVCYSFEKDYFYLLGGFKVNDILPFSKEYRGSLSSVNWSYRIKDQKLNEFLEKITLKKIKEADKIFNKCIDSSKK